MKKVWLAAFMVAGMFALQATADTTEPGGEPTVVRIGYKGVDALVAELQGLYTESAAVRLVTDPKQNALKIFAPPSETQTILKLVKQLDRPRARFSIKARLTLTDATGKANVLSLPACVVSDRKEAVLHIGESLDLSVMDGPVMLKDTVKAGMHLTIRPYLVGDHILVRGSMTRSTNSGKRTLPAGRGEIALVQELRWQFCLKITEPDKPLEIAPFELPDGSTAGLSLDIRRVK